jgi:hypothetical protein
LCVDRENKPEEMFHWEDESIVQGDRERQLISLSPAVILTLAMAGGIVAVAAIPRGPLSGLSFGLFIVDVFFAFAMYVSVRVAYQKAPLLSPGERFIPSVVVGFGFSILTLILNILVFGHLPEGPRLSEYLSFLLGCLITFIAIVWSIVTFRRSVMDHAWRSKKVFRNSADRR